MRKEIPFLISGITALFAVLAFFIPHRPFGGLQQKMLVWYSVVTGVAMLIGVQSLLNNHYKRIRRGENIVYSSFLIAGFLVTFVLGVYSIRAYGDAFAPNSPFMFIFNYAEVPLQSTMFALLAFFIASAAYRAMKIRTVEASLLLIAAVIVMLGRVPVGAQIWSGMPSFAEWIMQIPNLAAQRGILIGVALGSVGMSLRIILGIEKPYLR